jgi:hypothetical protein
MKNNLLVILLLTMSFITNAQSPQSIPYQAVVRNADGSIMSNTSITLAFKIHDATAIGTVVYEEMHATTSNAQGIVVMNVGEGTPVTGNFSNINWGNGAKFLQVLMDAGNGTLDLGTQQMMSVPYALYADDVNVRVSNSGDSLFIGDQFSIVPGVSAANPVSISNYGSVLLPGVTVCELENVSVTGCGGQESLTYYDLNYNLVEIGGQCWFAESLGTTKFNNGDSIPSTAYIHGPNAWVDFNYYHFYMYQPDVFVETREVCPTGFHKATLCDYYYLFNSWGQSVDQINQQVVPSNQLFYSNFNLQYEYFADPSLDSPVATIITSSYINQLIQGIYIGPFDNIIEPWTYPSYGGQIRCVKN